MIRSLVERGLSVEELREALGIVTAEQDIVITDDVSPPCIYEDAAVRMHCGDAHHVPPHWYRDAVVLIDPPYGAGRYPSDKAPKRWLMRSLITVAAPQRVRGAT